MRNKFNVTKTQILYAVRLLTKHEHIANSHAVGGLLGKDRQFAGRQLNRLDPTYITALRDNKRTDGCTLKYKLTKAGSTRLDKMLIRFRQGESLKLTAAPYPVDYSNFELLPGLKDSALYISIQKEEEEEKQRQQWRAEAEEKRRIMREERAEKVRKAKENEDTIYETLTQFETPLQVSVGFQNQRRQKIINESNERRQRQKKRIEENNYRNKKYR